VWPFLTLANSRRSVRSFLLPQRLTACGCHTRFCTTRCSGLLQNFNLPATSYRSINNGSLWPAPPRVLPLFGLRPDTSSTRGTLKTHIESGQYGTSGRPTLVAWQCTDFACNLCEFGAGVGANSRDRGQTDNNDQSEHNSVFNCCWAVFAFQKTQYFRSET